MLTGLLISTICDHETGAQHLAVGSFYPNILLSGVIWPLEGMSVYLRYMVYFLPQTYAIESLRNVFARGWGIERPDVYLGILTTLGWISITLVLSFVTVRVRKYTG